MKLAFLGSPDFAAEVLKELVKAGHEIAVVVTQPDRRRSRGSATQPTPVKETATSLNIPVIHDVKEILNSDVELGIVVAFGRIIKPDVLQKIPMINIHFSLLPRWRGAAPVERAILNGDEQTGVAIMQLVEELDAGPVYASESTTIGESETLSGLRGRLVDIGTRLLIDELNQGLSSPAPQIGEATYAEKLTSEELRIDWHTTSQEILRLIRLEHAWTSFRGKRLKILQAKAGSQSLAPAELSGVHVGTTDGSIELETVQSEGKKPQAASEWLNGVHPQARESFE